MSPRFGRVVLTGASSGIGRALAERLAGPGVALLLIARDEGRLAETAAAVRARGGAAETAALDVADRDATAAALAAFDAAGPVDLVIANAGVSLGLGPGRTPEDADAARRLWAVNLFGALNTVEPLLPAMIARRRGAVALMSSMAAIRPLPDMPSYSASKAALRALGEAWRSWLAPQGVAVTVICPGFVTSPMSARHRGFKPFEVAPERAAELIARGLARGAPYVTFPWPLALLSWLDRRLPPRLADLAGRGFAATIEPEARR